MSANNRAAADDSDIYVLVNELKSTTTNYHRLQELNDFYFSEFESRPSFFVRVPGRVNIIGEHVDYCGYPVLPMAIDQSILLAVGVSNDDNMLYLRNLEKEKFNNFKCDLNNIKIQVPSNGAPEWYNYFLCGVKGIFEALNIGDHQQPNHHVGMRIALSGNIPPASGLSSSSALVSAAVLCTAYIQEMPLNRINLASIAASCEQYIGTQGGGMDQAIAYLAKRGCAQYIEFHPKLKASPIQLPKNACFVVANSLAAKNKAASSDFNERVVECRMAAQLIAKHKQLSNWRELLRFRQLQDALQCNLDELLNVAMKCLCQDVYNRSEICQILEISEPELEQNFLTTNTLHMSNFKLRPRAMHVLQESLRVEKFKHICESAKEDEDNEQIQMLAELMQHSHESLKELYECSHPNLDKLITISKDMDISGVRLTGAGWGGCVVALCNSSETSEKYIQALKKLYFQQLPIDILEKHQHNNFSNVVFATIPQCGAEIFKIKEENSS